MEKTKPIMYGVSDYARLRKENGYFLDRTDFIHDLEVAPEARNVEM